MHAAVDDLDRPGRAVGGLEIGETRRGPCDREAQTDDFRDFRVPRSQRPHDRVRRRFERARRNDRRTDKLTELAVQAVFDLLLGQHEERDGDEEPRPSAEIEQERATTRQGESVSVNEAQEERNAPGERDKHRGPSAGQERIFAQKSQPTLQFKERSAMRGQIVPDPARFFLVEIVDLDRVALRSPFRHSLSFRRARSRFLTRIAIARHWPSSPRSVLRARGPFDRMAKRRRLEPAFGSALRNAAKFPRAIGAWGSRPAAWLPARNFRPSRSLARRGS